MNSNIKEKKTLITNKQITSLKIIIYTMQIQIFVVIR